MRSWTFLWRSIGKEFLIKSNINKWIACKEGSGSLVQQRDGTVSCKLVKQLSGQCSGVVPNRVKSSSADYYYYFEGNRSGGWPTHDPFGNNQANQLKGVANPHGNIFIR